MVNTESRQARPLLTPSYQAMHCLQGRCAYCWRTHTRDTSYICSNHTWVKASSTNKRCSWSTLTVNSETKNTGRSFYQLSIRSKRVKLRRLLATQRDSRWHGDTIIFLKRARLELKSHYSIGLTALERWEIHLQTRKHIIQQKMNIWFT